MKLNIDELIAVLSCLITLMDSNYLQNPESRINLASAIFKLQHQLKHLEDKEIK